MHDKGLTFFFQLAHVLDGTLTDAVHSYSMANVQHIHCERTQERNPENGQIVLASRFIRPLTHSNSLHFVANI